MFLSLFLVKRTFNFGRKPCKNIIIGGGVVVGALFLIHERNVYQRHQRYGVVALTSLVGLGVGVVPLGDELGGQPVVLFVFAVDDNFYLLVVDV